MSYLKKYNNFELIDFSATLQASKSFEKNKRLLQSLEQNVYKETQNGFVIVSVEEDKEIQNKHALDVLKESIFTFFSQITSLEFIIKIFILIFGIEY